MAIHEGNAGRKALQKGQLLVVPDVSGESLSQLLVTTVFLLPLHKAALQDKDLLLLKFLRAVSMLALARVPECSRWTTLLTQCAVENDLLSVLESANKLGHANVQAGSRDPVGGANVASDMIYMWWLVIEYVRDWHEGILNSPESRTSIIASLLAGVSAESRAARVSRLIRDSVAIDMSDIVSAQSKTLGRRFYVDCLTIFRGDTT